MTDGVVPTRESLLAWNLHAADSPLYQRLIEVTANAPELIEIIGQIRNLPQPNVYLAAIHYLLMEDPSAPLGRFYPSLVDDPLPPDDVGDPFRGFVLAHQDRIVEIANSRFTQTNECRRCTALLPAVMASPSEAFHLVEIGASAGLNLAVDRYKYRYDGMSWGPDSPLELSASVRGEMPKLRPIEVMRRVGIDLKTVDPGQDDDRRWLQALVWPEHGERRQRLDLALDLIGSVDIKQVEGSVLDVLGDVLNALPAGDPIVVMNSFVLNQLSVWERAEVAQIIDQARRRNPVFRVSLEFLGTDGQGARLEVGEALELTEIGRAHAHGEWVDLH